MVTQESILQDLMHVKKAVGRIPTKTIYRTHGKYNSSTVVRKFKSWNNALQKAFGQINIHRTVRIEHPCILCGQLTKNSKYCSSSCSASVNNKIPKRKKTSFCQMCGKYVKCTPRNSSNKRICLSCHVEEQIEKFGQKKISDFSSTYARHRYQGIRHHAHRVAKLHNLKKECLICGYDKHTHLSHKKPIADFPKNTKLFVVNHVDNLHFLCPNHHWELDAGILKF